VTVTEFINPFESHFAGKHDWHTLGLDRRYPAISTEQFKAIFSRHPGGLVVITTQGPHGPVALTASSLASVSADPPLMVFSLSANSSSTPFVVAAQTAVVHFIDAESMHIAKLAATSGVDRFADTTQWSRLDTGEPVFHDVPVWIRVHPIERLTAGNSTVVLAQGVEASLPAESLRELGPRDGLAYVNHEWHRLDPRSRVE
jgi:flavin reductase (DIM6/NTAB) family NADH-FMN oxidoreductase RutF